MEEKELTELIESETKELAQKQFLFAQLKIIHYLCNVISPRLGIMSFGWAVVLSKIEP